MRMDEFEHGFYSGRRWVKAAQPDDVNVVEVGVIVAQDLDELGEAGMIPFYVENGDPADDGCREAGVEQLEWVSGAEVARLLGEAAKKVEYSCFISYVDTCLPCYLTDHHDRDGEFLIGVRVDGGTKWSYVTDAIKQEWDGAEISDVEGEAANAALDAAFKRAHAEFVTRLLPNATFDNTLDPPSEDDDAEGPQAYFVVEYGRVP